MSTPQPPRNYVPPLVVQVVKAMRAYPPKDLNAANEPLVASVMDSLMNAEHHWSTTNLLMKHATDSLRYRGIPRTHPVLVLLRCLVAVRKDGKCDLAKLEKYLFISGISMENAYLGDHPDHGEQ